MRVAIANAPQLRVRTIAATVPDGAPVTRDAVSNAAHIDPDANLWLSNTGAIRARARSDSVRADGRDVHRAQVPQAGASTIDVTLRTPTRLRGAAAAR